VSRGREHLDFCESIEAKSLVTCDRISLRRNKSEATIFCFRIKDLPDKQKPVSTSTDGELAKLNLWHVFIFSFYINPSRCLPIQEHSARIKPDLSCNPETTQDVRLDALPRDF